MLTKVDKIATAMWTVDERTQDCLCSDAVYLNVFSMLNEYLQINRAHSFPQATEFQAKVSNLSVSTEFPYFHRILWNYLFTCHKLSNYKS